MRSRRWQWAAALGVAAVLVGALLFALGRFGGPGSVDEASGGGDTAPGSGLPGGKEAPGGGAAPAADGPCAGLTEVWQVQDCLNRQGWDRSGLISSYLKDGGVHLVVRKGATERTRQEMERMGVPADAVVIKERQPMAHGGRIEPEDGRRIPHRLLASQKKFPPWEEMEGQFVIIRLAEGSDRYRELWSLFRLEGEPVAVDWETEGVLFVGQGESGSCPEKLEGFTLSPEGVLQVHTAFDGEFYGCTDDLTPRTFVAAVPKAELPDGAIPATLKGLPGGPVFRLREE